LIEGSLIGKFPKGEFKMFDKGVGFISPQHVVGAQQAGEARHGFADHSQVRDGEDIAGLDLICKAPDEDTEQGNLIPEDDPLGGLQAPAFGEGKVFGVEAMLGQRLMALGTSLMRLVAAQFEGVGVSGLAAALFAHRLFGCSKSVWLCDHV
jgi:hypothetical protein